MPQSPEYGYEVAYGLSRGERELQEDALATDFPHRGRLGFAVLADGMGGHAAGEVASKIVVTEIFAELKLQSGLPDAMERSIGSILRAATLSANACIEAHSEANPDTNGMGTTLVAPILFSNRLYWMSVGDSPLYLMRDGKLVQLNEDHSLAPQIDFMVEAGLIDPAVGQNHPDRSCLTSVLSGGTIDKFDCCELPHELKAGDILLVSSDGLQTLSNDQISAILYEHRQASPDHIVDALLTAISDAGDPYQDNVTLCVIRMVDRASSTARRPSAQIVPLHPDHVEALAQAELILRQGD